MPVPLLIRPERPEDIPSVRLLNQQAFGRPDEACLVDALRTACDTILSLVAFQGNALVGHVLFTPATIQRPSRTVAGMALAPMAVLPAFQRQGIGSALVEQGLSLLRERGCPFVVVLGHAGYYPRFGFRPAACYKLRCQWPGVPSEVFMALFFDGCSPDEAVGIVHYRKEFNDFA